MIMFVWGHLGNLVAVVLVVLILCVALLIRLAGAVVRRRFRKHVDE